MRRFRRATKEIKGSYGSDESRELQVARGLLNTDRNELQRAAWRFIVKVQLIG